jgi:hypothetical protein
MYADEVLCNFEKGRKGVRTGEGGGGNKTYGIRKCDVDDDDDDDPPGGALLCSLFQNRDLYAGQVLKFQALTRKLCGFDDFLAEQVVIIIICLTVYDESQIMDESRKKEQI